jgi:hypothetical protein
MTTRMLISLFLCIAKHIYINVMKTANLAGK